MQIDQHRKWKMSVVEGHRINFLQYKPFATFLEELSLAISVIGWQASTDATWHFAANILKTIGDCQWRHHGRTENMFPPILFRADFTTSLRSMEKCLG